jgi:hypothetical protein
MTPIELILSKLEKVRQRQPNQWSACCPSHEDKSPSLSIRETEDGAVLIFCFSGCSTKSIVDSLCINMSDLFPPKSKSGNEPKRLPRKLTSSQALEILDDEANFIAIAALNLSNQKTLTSTDLKKCAVAASKISQLRNVCEARYD